ncbi:hypothetical protein SS50377_25619 [Spironucleus salmonicida]|uniref:Leucine Rich Repeat family protein n=1 Tax=Spironucleus salmonicida TaxID=348837 RepID=V6LY34_9EUKA|nr:hypothetical protein SS50377_25619 [Spironucleus salmonicida]|eukprot:EST49480.1 hypothetical protein SS50377_10229 [Spironucleus salmonicida]
MTYRFSKITFDHIRSISISPAKILDLWQCEFNEHTFREFLIVLPCLYIESLDLGASNLNNSQFIELFSVLSNQITSPKGLKQLLISRNIFQSSFKQLSIFIGSPHCIVEELDLRDCDITNQQLDILIDGLALNLKNQSLIKILNLRKNKIQTSGAVRLANLLDSSYQYIKVDLNLNSVSEIVLARFEKKVIQKGIPKVEGNFLKQMQFQSTNLNNQKEHITLSGNFRKSNVNQDALDIQYQKFQNSKIENLRYSDYQPVEKLKNRRVFKNFEDDSVLRDLQMEEFINPIKMVSKKEIRKKIDHEELNFNYDHDNYYLQNQFQTQNLHFGNINRQNINDDIYDKPINIDVSKHTEFSKDITYSKINNNEYTFQKQGKQGQSDTLFNFVKNIKDEQFQAQSPQLLKDSCEGEMLALNGSKYITQSNNDIQEVNIVQAQTEVKKQQRIKIAEKVDKLKKSQQSMKLQYDQDDFPSNIVTTTVSKLSSQRKQQVQHQIKDQPVKVIKQQLDQFVQVGSGSIWNNKFLCIQKLQSENFDIEKQLIGNEQPDLSEILNLIGNIPDLYYKLKPSKQVQIIIQKLNNILVKEQELTEINEGAQILQETFVEIHQTLIKQGLSIKAVENHEDPSSIQNYVIGIAIEMFKTIQTILGSQQEDMKQ